MTFTKIALAAASLLLAGAAQAQVPAPPKGTEPPNGQMSTPNQDKGPQMRSGTDSRQAVKDEAKAARAAGSAPMGEQSTPTQGKKPMAAPTSNTSRAAVKAEAAAANKSGDKPMGQESVKDQNKGGTGTKP